MNCLTPSSNKALREWIITHFGREDINTLCSDLIHTAELIGKHDAGLETYANEVIRYFQKRGRLDQLTQALRDARPGLDFPDLVKTDCLESELPDDPPADFGRPRTPLKKLIGEHRHELDRIRDVWRQVATPFEPKAVLLYSPEGAVNIALVKAFMAEVQASAIVLEHDAFLAQGRTKTQILGKWLDQLERQGIISDGDTAEQRLKAALRELRRVNKPVLWVFRDLDLAPADIFQALQDVLTEARRDGGLLLLATAEVDAFPQPANERAAHPVLRFAATLERDKLGLLLATRYPVSALDVVHYLQPCAREVSDEVDALCNGSAIAVQTLWEDWQREGVVVQGAQGWAFAPNHPRRIYGQIKDRVRDEANALLAAAQAELGDEEPMFDGENLHTLLGLAALEGESFTAEALAPFFAAQGDDAPDAVLDDLVAFLDDWLLKRRGALPPLVRLAEPATLLFGRELNEHRFAHPYQREAYRTYLPDPQTDAQDLIANLEKLYEAATWRIAGKLQHLCQLVADATRDAATRQQYADKAHAYFEMRYKYAAYTSDIDHLAVVEGLLAQLQTAPTQEAEQRFVVEVMSVLLRLVQLRQVKPARLLAVAHPAQAMAAKLGWTGEQAEAEYYLGWLYKDSGKPQDALTWFASALVHLRKQHQRAGEASTLNNMGGVYNAIGQREKALELYEEALSIQRAVGNRAGEAATLSNMGGVYNTIGQHEKALELYEEALPILSKVGDLADVAATLNNMGSVYNAIGQREKALELFEEALPIQQAVGDRAGEATTLHNMGSVYDAIGQREKALELYEEALPIRHEVGDRAGMATTLNNMGLVYNGLGQREKALELMRMAVQIFNEIGDVEHAQQTQAAIENILKS